MTVPPIEGWVFFEAQPLAFSCPELLPVSELCCQIIAQNHWESVRSFLGHSSKNGHFFTDFVQGCDFSLSIPRGAECQSEITPPQKGIWELKPWRPHWDTWEPLPLLSYLQSVFERHIRSSINNKLISSQQLCFLLSHPSAGDCCGRRCSLCPWLMFLLLSMLLPGSQLIDFTHLRSFGVRKIFLP